MKNKSKNILFLGITLFIAGCIYLYKLETIPNGFYVDEAVVAYNAYSIEETGKDAFGQPYPVLFRLLGSYTPPLFIYISSVLVKFFGMRIAVFRIISVVSALISVVFFYLLTKRMDLFKNERLYIITSLFYAISPWMVFNARLGYEVTLAYSLFNIGLFFLFLGLENSLSIVWAAIFLSLSTYTAHTQRFLVPLFCLFYFIFFAKDIFNKKNIKNLLLALMVTIVIQIPHFSIISTPAFWVKNDRLLEPGGSKIFKNIINQTASYLSVKNIFYKLSDIDLQHTVPEISVMYNFMIIPFMFGIYLLLKNRKERKFKFLLLIFFITLVPAVLSGEFISIQRALPFLLPLMITIGMGMDYISWRLNTILNVLLFPSLLIYSLLMLFRSYFIMFPVERAEAWNFGYEEIAYYISKNNNSKYLIDNTRNPRNYILLLYYLNYPPQKYHDEVDSRYKINYYTSLPPENSYKFSNVEVREINWQYDSYLDHIIVGDSLSISDSQSKDHFLTKVYAVKDPKGDILYTFYKTSPEMKCKLSWKEEFCKVN